MTFHSPWCIINVRGATLEPFPYVVKNFVLLKHEIEELNRKKLILLIPFYTLKLRDELKKTGEINLDALRHLLKDDILGSIEANLKFGNISQKDYNELIKLTNDLSQYLYSDVLMKAGEDMGRLFPDALILPGDDLRYQIQTLEDHIAEQDATIAEQDALIASLQSRLAQYEKLDT